MIDKQRVVGAIECFKIFLLRSKRCFWGRVRASCFELSCAWTGFRDEELSRIDDASKECDEYSVLALYSNAKGIDLSKTRGDFANEVWRARERMFGGEKRDGDATG